MAPFLLSLFALAAASTGAASANPVMASRRGLSIPARPPFCSYDPDPDVRVRINETETEKRAIAVPTGTTTAYELFGQCSATQLFWPSGLCSQGSTESGTCSVPRGMIDDASSPCYTERAKEDPPACLGCLGSGLPGDAEGPKNEGLLPSLLQMVCSIILMSMTVTVFATITLCPLLWPSGEGPVGDPTSPTARPCWPVSCRTRPRCTIKRCSAC